MRFEKHSTRGAHPTQSTITLRKDDVYRSSAHAWRHEGLGLKTSSRRSCSFPLGGTCCCDAFCLRDTSAGPVQQCLVVHTAIRETFLAPGLGDDSTVLVNRSSLRLGDSGLSASVRRGFRQLGRVRVLKSQIMFSTGMKAVP